MNRYADMVGNDIVFDFGGGDTFTIDGDTALAVFEIGTIASDIVIV